MRRIVFVAAVMAIGAVSFSAPLSPQIAYQGIISGSTGIPVRDSAGYSLVFSLDTTEGGTTPVWKETQKVTTKQGYFSVMLGSVVPLTSLPFDRQYWLSIKFSDGKPVAPKIRLSTVPYAGTACDLSSEQLDFIYAGQQVIVDQWSKAMDKDQSEVIACSYGADLLGAPMIPNPDTTKYELLYFLSGCFSNTHENAFTVQLNNKELVTLSTWSSVAFRRTFKSAMWHSWEQFEQQAVYGYSSPGLNLRITQNNGSSTLSLWGIAVNWVYVRKGVNYPSLF